MTKNDQLEALKKHINTQNPCAELSAQATQLVFGSGNVDADIVLIGEAPGKKEDMTGEPFIGASGKFLGEMLASAGLDRADMYITNIVKYRPPENRDPTPAEKAVFWPYLIEQLTIIAPKVIVTLGRHSGQAFKPDLRISADHGIPFQYELLDGSLRHSCLVVPLYHPAAALYNGSLRQTLLNDFQKVAELINN